MVTKKEVLFTSGWRKFTLMQPPLFLVVFTVGITGITTTDMIVYRTCQLLMKSNKTSCDLLHTNSSNKEALQIEKLVHPYASYIILCDSLINGIISAALIIFLGPWSDKYGRKPLLISGYLAPTLRYIILAILNCWNVNPWMFLIASVSSALIGGGAGLMLATVCYITDITSIENRSWHLACLDGAAMAGVIIGTLLGPLIFQQFGYVVIFTIASILSIIALLHIVLYVPETVQKEENVRLGNPFNLRSVKEMFMASIKQRPGFNRTILWSCILFVSLFMIFLSGEGKIYYLFANACVGWNSRQFSVNITIAMIVTTIGSMIGLKLTKKYLGFTDISHAITGCVSNFITMIIIAFTSKSWHLHLAAFASIFAGMTSPGVRSIISTSVPQEDTGKIFTLLTLMESIVSLAGVPLFTLVYSQFMPPIYPSPVYLLSAGIFLLMILILIFINWKMVKHPSTIQEDVQKD